MPSDQNSVTKRSRSDNYTENEKELLLIIISEFRKIVENKKTDGLSVKEKDETWKKISVHFNAENINGTLRTPSQLRCCWDNLRRRYRKLHSELGDEKFIQQMDFINRKALFIMNDNRFVRLIGTYCPYDSDADYHKGLIPTTEELSYYQLSGSKKEKLSYREILKDERSRYRQMRKIMNLDLPEADESVTPEPKEQKEDFSFWLALSRQEDAKKQSPITKHTLSADFPPPASSSSDEVREVPSSPKKLRTDNSVSPQESAQADLWEEKVKLARLATRHAANEEARKEAIFELEVEERRFRIELLKEQLKNEKNKNVQLSFE